ncbi:MAG TPA: RNA polymerase sigma-70 factor [Bacteroidales bacterium]|nr:RNA polymerase sigma-70 factor [Bacteroidales bacterium]
MVDQLALRIKLGDELAFEILFHRYFIRLCSFANKFLNDPDQAQEIVQESFVKIWENRKDIDPEDSLKSYLFQIVKNLSLNKLRRKKVESKYIEIYKLVYIERQEFSAEESLLSKELEENIANAIKKLPAKCRIVFELSRIEGLKYREIADNLHISVKTVESQMSKALRFLRIELSDYLNLLLIALICMGL